MTLLQKCRFAWKFRRQLWKYRHLIKVYRHRRELIIAAGAAYEISLQARNRFRESGQA